MDSGPNTGRTSCPEETVTHIDLRAKPTMRLFTFLPTGANDGIRIIQIVAVKYNVLGALLLNDKDGVKTELIALAHPQKPVDIAYGILVEWLNYGGREPLTWDTFITVLKEMGLKQLAHDLEKLAGLEMGVQSSSQQKSDDDVDCVLTSASDVAHCSIVLVNSIDLSKMIKELKKQFQCLKKMIKECLEKHKIPVEEVADVLTSLSPDDDDCHKIFLESHVKELDKAENHSQLFLTMNSHWNYLDPSLLGHLVDELELEGDMCLKMKAYGLDLERFRKKTPLELFCKTQKRRHVEIPSNFKKMVAKFDWPKTVLTLEDAENFRVEYAHHYSLHECAMMLVEVQPGSIIIIWLIPTSIVEKLKENVPSVILAKYDVVQLIIAGTCVFSADNEAIDAGQIVKSESYAMFPEDEWSSDEDTSKTPCLDSADMVISMARNKALPAPPTGLRTSHAVVEDETASEVSDLESCVPDSLKNKVRTELPDSDGTALDSLDSKVEMVNTPVSNGSESTPITYSVDETPVPHTVKCTEAPVSSEIEVPQFASTGEAANQVIHLAEDTKDSSATADTIVSPSKENTSVSQAKEDIPVSHETQKVLLSYPVEDTQVSGSEEDASLPYKEENVPVPHVLEHTADARKTEGAGVSCTIESIQHSHTMKDTLVPNVKEDPQLADKADDDDFHTMEHAIYGVDPPTPNKANSLDRRSEHVAEEPTEVLETTDAKSRPQAPPRRYFIQAKVRQFKRRFAGLKKSVRDSLNERKVPVSKVTDVLKSVAADDAGKYKLFTENRMELIDQAMDHSEVIGNLGFNMDFLSYHILELFASEFNLEDVKVQLEYYKKALRNFMILMPLTSFARAQQGKQIKLLPEFQEVVAEFERPTENTKNLTLDTMHEFHRNYMAHFKLKGYTMTFGGIRPGSSVITCTWYIPQLIADVLKAEAPKDLLSQHHITMLRVAGTCVYHKKKRADSDYPFVEEPSEEFFCPVTMGLLLQPHLTTCCGKHLSEEAVTKIRERQKGKCPLCKESKWNTVLNKDVQRKVKDLRVFCHYEHKGCRWQGELRDFDNHVVLCSTKFPQPRPRPILRRDLSTSVFEQNNTDSGSTSQSNHSHCSDQEPIESTGAFASEALNLKQLTVQCHQRKTAPYGITRGSATSDGQCAYFTPLSSTTLYKYEYTTERWEQLPPCPYEQSGLAIVNDELTTFGGRDKSGWTNKVMTLRFNGWDEEYPRMKTGCSHPTVANGSDGEYHLVVGGYVGVENRTTTCELFQAKSRYWYRATDLPKSLLYPSATITGNRLHVIGDRSTGYSCLLPDLPPTDQEVNLALILAWEPLPPLPVTKSTTSNLFGQLVLIGGMRNGLSVNTIHQLVDEQWVKIGSMNNSTWLTLAVKTSPKEIIIVGGGSGGRNNVEECIVET